ncbi:adenylate/guanylate cyclase domain-containing protein [Enhygromyxa salina]|uniref:Adenylate cyclase 1 n=1 Tax=Enhygromyxa salina TaxID=215803 RepID=A0A2S9Y4N9_9BACT|nr:adenylate/guanylate cyclase domain-containing protein [Enhygromyxa salina]PRP99970.1 Adenylate cyclase 1 [Enhygromyxa salina]
MPPAVDTTQLSEALTQLERAQAWPPGLLDELRDLISSATDEALFQINPVSYATARGRAPELGIALFLHAARAGLMQIDWSLRCCGCGELVSNRGGLAQLDSDFYCDSCARSSAANLDENVEVAFTVAPSVRPLRFHAPDSLSLEDYFYRFRFSRDIVIRGLDKPLVAFLREQALILAWLEPDAELVFELDIPEQGWVVGHPRTMITTIGAPTRERRELTLDYHDRAFHPRPELAPGPVRLTLRNKTAERVRVLKYFTPIVTYFDYLPHLSGRRLLNNPEFRRCLGTEVVRPGTGIPVKDCTLLFTDLRGSTAMYDLIGDNAAFELVTESFEVMAQIVTRCGGVVVKTMGDAIMASFNHPADGVRAGLQIILNEHGELQPKVGLHRGPCIVVNQNDMVDYFGQTVNVAARVQGEAAGNELCLTEAVWDDVREDQAVAASLAEFGELQRELRALKGVSEPVPLYRVRVR